MIHTAVNTGAGWSCSKCRRAWDQGETPPEECEPDAYPMNTVEPPLVAEAGLWSPIGNPMSVQHGGRHYKDLAIQPTEFCMRNGLDFCIGSILKYVTRHRAKNGIEDLRKARHFVEIRESFPWHIRPPGRIEITMLEYVTRNSIRPDDAEALYRLEAYYNAVGPTEHWAHKRNARRVIEEIDRLIVTAY